MMFSGFFERNGAVPFVTEARASNISEDSSEKVRTKLESGFLVMRHRKLYEEPSKEVPVG